MISDEWYHRGGSFAEGGAFVDIELFFSKSPYTKAFGYKTLGLVMPWFFIWVGFFSC